MTPFGNTNRTTSGNMRVRASAVEKFISRSLEFVSSFETDGASEAPTMSAASALPFMSASTAALPEKGSRVAVFVLMSALLRSLSAV